MKGRFTRLVLENWRNFKKVDVQLGERVFVVGANASGKSNLLDVFRFLQELAVDGGGLTNALERSNRGGLRAVRSLHAGKNSALRILVETMIDDTTWSYELELQATGTSQKPGQAVIVRENVLADGEQHLRRPDPADKKDTELLFATALEQRSANATFRPLRDFLRSIDYIHLVPQLVRQPKAEDQSRFGKGLGTGLIEAIWLTGKQERTRRLKRIERGLRHVLPQFESLEVEPDKAGRPHLRAKYKHWRRSGGWQEESAFSDGTLRLIGLLWYLSGGNSPLLLEEPEMSLHPAAVRQIPRILADLNASTGRQILMSSHSPELLGDRGINPSEVLLLRATKDATDVTVGSDEASLVEAAAADLPLGPYLEALTRPPQWLELAQFGSSGSITIAVEGDTDIPFVTTLCKSAGFEVREPLLDAGGKQSLDKRIVGFARAGHGSPHLVLRDLDQDAECAPRWLQQNAPEEVGAFFSVRLAVRAVEAWFLADAETAANCLHISKTRIPIAPDEERDPKLTVVNLSRSSTKPRIQDGLVPLPGMKRKAGRDYERWLLESAGKWRLDRAIERSPSLARAHAALCKLKARWETAKQ